MQVLTSSPQVSSQPAQTDTTASAAAQTTATDTTGNTATPATAASEEKQVFSSRGEKFAQLNKEFDITGADFKITNGFPEPSCLSWASLQRAKPPSWRAG